MSSPKCRSVKVINNPTRPGSNHMEVNCINYKQQQYNNNNNTTIVTTIITITTITIITIIIIIIIIIIKMMKKKLMRTLRWKINVRIKQQQISRLEDPLMIFQTSIV